MLTSLSLFCSFFLFSFFFQLSFSFIISFIGFVVFFLFAAVYVSFLGFSFVSFYGCLEVFSCFLIIMRFWITFLMILVSVNYRFGVGNNYFVFVVLSLLVVVSFFFFTDHLLFFYVAFEVSLLPTLLLILKWGYQPERLQAGFYFMMYTMCASLPLLLLVMKFGSDMGRMYMGFDYPFSSFGLYCSSYLFYFVLVFAFLVKVPI